ncbi:MAG: YtxH domain-containing protein [Rikenellaceae bacterium]|nr:YtxH domain-containing protein [Rikenellaceae bacterium]
MKTIFAFLGGAMAGAAAALLMAPEKGDIMRRKLRHAMNHGITRADWDLQMARMKADRAAREAIHDIAEAAKQE